MSSTKLIDYNHKIEYDHHKLTLIRAVFVNDCGVLPINHESDIPADGHIVVRHTRVHAKSDRHKNALIHIYDENTIAIDISACPDDTELLEITTPAALRAHIECVMQQSRARWQIENEQRAAEQSIRAAELKKNRPPHRSVELPIDDTWGESWSVFSD